MPRLQCLQGRRALWLLGLVLVIGLGAERALTLAHAAPTDFDDAYMYLRYAKHVLAGHGISWNAGEGGVYGVTSLLHLFVLAKLRWAFPGLGSAALLRIASGSAAAALLAALVGIVALHARHPRLRRNWLRVILGLSGGIDSALVATIAADALGPDAVHVVLMPSRYSSEHSVGDAENWPAAGAARPHGPDRGHG